MRKFLRLVIAKLRSLLGPLLKSYPGLSPYLLTFGIGLILVIGGINLFVELTDTLSTETLKAWDQRLTDYVLSFRSPGLTRYFRAVTEIGDVHGYLVILALSVLGSIFIFKRWKYIAQVALVLVLASVSNMMLKRFIDRARPGIEHLVVVKTLSYPSGHAMSAMAFYGFLIYLVYRMNLKRWVKGMGIGLLALLILSIGISRIYLGVHFPSDILGGFIAGLIWVVFCILIFGLIEIFRKDPTTGSGAETDPGGTAIRD